MEHYNEAHKFLRKINSDTTLNLEAEINKLKSISGKRYSDVLDKDGNQYVDLVQQGGGVWGVALVGYVYVLEQVGIRFFSLAGTSAGAINALAMASIAGKKRTKTEPILEALLALEMKSLIDGKKEDTIFTTWERKLISKLLKFPFYKKFILNFMQWLFCLCISFTIASMTSLLFFLPNEGRMLHFITIGIWVVTFILAYITYDRLSVLTRDGFGLNDGDVFHEWVKKALLEKQQVKNLDDLKTNFNQLPDDLYLDTTASHRTITEEKPQTPRLTIIANDVTTNNKIEFPKMWDLYFDATKEVHPADFVRASMSIPIFFETFTLDTKPNNINAWNTHLNWGTANQNCIPDKVFFVDGGSLSNFPINIFYNPNYSVPRMPTLGIRLIDKKIAKIENCKSILEFGGNIIQSMKLSSDKEFLNKNQSYNMGIGYVEIGETLSWLNFYMNEAEKEELFKIGAKAALDFLRTFDWDDYKNKRKAEQMHMVNTKLFNPNNW